MGPLEEEVNAVMRQALLSDPTLHGLLTGRLKETDLADLQISSNVKFAELILRAFDAQQEILKRLAQEIDAIKAAPDGGDEPPDPG